MTSTISGATVHRALRRVAIVLATLLAARAGAVPLPPAAGGAAPISNSVDETAFIWNCPTGAPGCFPGPQTRVGDVRVGDPIADLCHGNFSGRLKNLVWNQTGRAGAAERTGFLYQSTLSSKSQRDSCYTSGVELTAIFLGATQRLCPYNTCGSTGRVPRDNMNWVMREFCNVDRGSVNWRLVVAYNKTTNGPLTAGFVNEAALDDPFRRTQVNCDLI
ncbi:hypothetical protein K1W54_19185 [Micromonospora sp. CPCC 205371]|nr:hypothetical protein [Micromonospora sp. CPCC 205371]